MSEVNQLLNLFVNYNPIKLIDCHGVLTSLSSDHFRHNMMMTMPLSHTGTGLLKTDGSYPFLFVNQVKFRNSYYFRFIKKCPKFLFLRLLVECWFAGLI